MGCYTYKNRNKQYTEKKMERINELMSEETANTTDTVNMIHTTSEKEIVVVKEAQAKMEALGFKVGVYNWTP